MQNPNHIRLPENILEEDKFHNEGLISFIDNDYVLNFINDPESAQRRYIEVIFHLIVKDLCLKQTLLML